LTSTGLVVVGALAGGQPDAVLVALARRGVLVYRSGGGTTAPTRAPAPLATPTVGSAPLPSAPAAAFGSAAATSYLQHELVPKGTLLTQYRTLDDAELPNAIALGSGQPPNPQTQADCSTYADVPATAKPDASGAIAEPGCVYPVTTLTLADQLSSAGRRWRAYVQGIGAGKTCRRPAAGAADPTAALAAPDPADPYATRRNPFVYFHSLLDLGDCTTRWVPLAFAGVM
jgi:hypothetical protein